MAQPTATLQDEMANRTQIPTEQPSQSARLSGCTMCHETNNQSGCSICNETIDEEKQPPTTPTERGRRRTKEEDAEKMGKLMPQEEMAVARTLCEMWGEEQKKAQ